MIFCSALAFLAGCSTAPNEPPPNWSATNQVLEAKNQLQLKPLPPLNQTNLPPVARTNLLSVANTNPPPAASIARPNPAPVYTWTSLKSWTAEQKINSPLLLSKS